MTVKEIKKIVELAVMYHEDDYYSLDITEDLLEYEEKVYEPVKKAIAENDLVVISYLENCTSKEQSYVSTGIEDGLRETAAVNEGVIREGYERAVNLYRKVHRENAFTSDCI